MDRSRRTCNEATQAAGLIANTSSQRFYVNEQRIKPDAYEIGGSNYVKLRDIGEAVDFGVTYDAATNTVTIRPDAPYKMTATVPAISQPELPKEAVGRFNAPDGDYIFIRSLYETRRMLYSLYNTMGEDGWIMRRPAA